VKECIRVSLFIFHMKCFVVEYIEAQVRSPTLFKAHSPAELQLQSPIVALLAVQAPFALLHCIEEQVVIESDEVKEGSHFDIKYVPTKPSNGSFTILASNVAIATHDRRMRSG
jgi:hypothetical protein